MIDVKIHKVHPDAVIPAYAHPGDAGMDVTAVAINVTDDYIEYDTGLQFQLPPGYVMLIFPRTIGRPVESKMISNSNARMKIAENINANLVNSLMFNSLAKR